MCPLPLPNHVCSPSTVKCVNDQGCPGQVGYVQDRGPLARVKAVGKGTLIECPLFKGKREVQTEEGLRLHW